MFRLIIIVVTVLASCASPAFGQSQQPRQFTGAVAEADDQQPRPVRNDTARAGDEIITLRYFRIKKGSFDEFLKVSVDGVWPYFEKMGARVIGMWKVITPQGIDGLASSEAKDYDEVYLSTRYVSVDHWKASREPIRHGGNGPDWEKCKQALERRRALTLSTNVIFLKGTMAANGPYFMPGLDESYVKKPAK